MQHRRIILALVSTLAIATPAAAWSVNGAFEPDTLDDVEDGRMYLEPDQEAQGWRVYFNAIPEDRNSISFNPNVGALGSRYVPVGQMGMSAWLGVWKDCNADGYVGMAETALEMYRSELLLDDSICPPGSTFNRFSWVSEFLHISPEPNNQSATMPRVVYDPNVRVWGDFGRPDMSGEVHYDCAQAPFQAGTFDSSGGVLLYFDCQLGYAGAQTIGDAGGLAGIDTRYEDIYHPERDCDHPLYVHIGLYGRDPCAPGDRGTIEDGDAPPVATVWDCSTPAEGNLTEVPDPQGGEPLLGVPNQQPLAPAAGDSEGSVYTAAWGAAFPCEQDDSTVFNGEFVLGADFSGTNPSDGKRLADFDMGWGGLDGSVGTTPTGLGIHGVGSGTWGSSVTYLPPTYLGGTIRNGDLNPAGGLWFTFYAYVSPATLAAADLPNEAPGVYGAEPCGEATEGVHGGWDCDVSHWWNPALGGSANDDGPVPGDLYHLRDTDCYDGSVAEGSGVYASLALLSADPACPTTGAPVLG